jgi:hypothetical protein
VPSECQNNFFVWTKTQVSLEDEEESEDPFMANTKVAFYEVRKLNFQIKEDMILTRTSLND